jgi:hypothetical protein
VDSDYILNGVIVGLSWFAINIILDALILIPIMKTSFADYFMSIGLSYISIPTISICNGLFAHQESKTGMKINKEWHEKNKMPKNAKFEERLNGIWHIKIIVIADQYLKSF